MPVPSQPSHGRHQAPHRTDNIFSFELHNFLDGINHRLHQFLKHVDWCIEHHGEANVIMH